MVALDVPLLFEPREKRVDITLCVSAPENIQRSRVLARPHDLGKIRPYRRRAIADAEKRKRADYVIDTEKNMDDVRKQLAHIIEKPPKEKNTKKI